MLRLALFMTLFAVSSFATTEGQAPVPASAGCPTVLVTEHLYGRPAYDVIVPAEKLDRLEVVQKWSSWAPWASPTAVELGFDGKRLASLGYGDTFTYDATVPLHQRFDRWGRWDVRKRDLLRIAALRWQTELERAKLMAVPVTIKLHSVNAADPEGLLASTASAQLFIAAPNVRKVSFKYVPAAEANCYPQVLMYYGARPVAFQQVGAPRNADDVIHGYRTETRYALDKNQGLVVKIGEAGAFTVAPSPPNGL